MVDQVTATRLRSLYAILPQRGFEYREGSKIIRHYPDAIAFINTLNLSVISFTPKQVDRRLSELFQKAQEYTNSTENAPEVHTFLNYQPAFEYAAKNTFWSVHLDPTIVVEAMNYLCGARSLYIKFTTYRTPPPHQLRVPEGKLAKAIDGHTGKQPATRPLPCFQHMEPRLVDMMMERMRRGLGADWDKCSDYNDESEETTAAEDRAEMEPKQKLERTLGGHRIYADTYKGKT